MEHEFAKLNTFDDTRLIAVVEDLSIIGYDDDQINPALRQVLMDQDVDSETITHIYLVREVMRIIENPKDKADNDGQSDKEEKET